MFGIDFYPTPEDVIDIMLQGLNVEGKIILEPSAGSGNIVKRLKISGALEVLACEIDKELQRMLFPDCKLLCEDFLTLTSDKISHIDAIVMNPPFSDAVKHILHAWEIAPDGCDIVMLCPWSLIENSYSRGREEFNEVIRAHGSAQDLGECFKNAQRATHVKVALVRLKKPGENYTNEFEGFFMDEEDDQDRETPGILSYDFIRDVVNRYTGAVKIFDKQLSLAREMSSMLGGFYTSKLCMSVTEDGKPVLRNDFKKDLQKSAWQFIFSKMKMDKYNTKKLREDLNKFVEHQQQIPFTMKNIYVMLETIAGTHKGRMDEAVLEVFEKITKHHHENRHNVEGWKTNSHYVLTEKFIAPRCTERHWESNKMRFDHSGMVEAIDDLVKALCYITGENYDKLEYKRLYDFGHQRKKDEEGKEYQGKLLDFGTWYDWTFFEVKGFKKGTAHFKFKDQQVWALFNRRIAELKGFELFEHTSREEKAKYKEEAVTRTEPVKVLRTIKINV